MSPSHEWQPISIADVAQDPQLRANEQNGGLLVGHHGVGEDAYLPALLPLLERGLGVPQESQRLVASSLDVGNVEGAQAAHLSRQRSRPSVVRLICMDW
jgi:hypothetical protein